jgi:hypothetical protein
MLEPPLRRSISVVLISFDVKILKLPFSCHRCRRGIVVEYICMTARILLPLGSSTLTWPEGEQWGGKGTGTSMPLLGLGLGMLLW